MWTLSLFISKGGSTVDPPPPPPPGFPTEVSKFRLEAGGSRFRPQPMRGSGGRAPGLVG